jgi:GMP synthase-like glutamine amidotransferase
MRHLIAYKKNITSKKLADLFIMHMWRLHGLSNTIISVRGEVFASEFWKHICMRLGIEPRLSIAFHPEIDGQRTTKLCIRSLSQSICELFTE